LQQPKTILFPYTTLFRSDGDKLVIEYNDKSKGKEITEAKNPQLQLIKHLVEQAENHSLTFSKPQQPINPSHSNPNNDKLVIGLRSEEHTSELQSLRHLVC